MRLLKVNAMSRRVNGAKGENTEFVSFASYDREIFELEQNGAMS